MENNPTVTLLLTRHGQTRENVLRVLQGQMPGELTDEGIRQAEELRDSLVGTPIDLIISSDLKRAADTAQIINSKLHLPLTLDPLIRERDFGTHTGMPYAGITGELDPSAETVEQMFARASAWLRKVYETYPDKTILVICHGLFLRVIQGAFYGKTIRDIKPMDNAEVRTISLTAESLSHLTSEKEENLIGNA